LDGDGERLPLIQSWGGGNWRGGNRGLGGAKKKNVFNFRKNSGLLKKKHRGDGAARGNASLKGKWGETVGHFNNWGSNLLRGSRFVYEDIRTRAGVTVGSKVAHKGG